MKSIVMGLALVTFNVCAMIDQELYKQQEELFAAIGYNKEEKVSVSRYWISDVMRCTHPLRGRHARSHPAAISDNVGKNPKVMLGVMHRGQQCADWMNSGGENGSMGFERFILEGDPRQPPPPLAHGHDREVQLRPRIDVT